MERNAFLVIKDSSTTTWLVSVSHVHWAEYMMKDSKDVCAHRISFGPSILALCAFIPITLTTWLKCVPHVPKIKSTISWCRSASIVQRISQFSMVKNVPHALKTNSTIKLSKNVFLALLDYTSTNHQNHASVFHKLIGMVTNASPATIQNISTLNLCNANLVPKIKSTT